MNEEDQWKAKLTDHVGAECRRQVDEDATTPPLYSILDLQVKSIGQAFGLPGTLSRKLSLQRALTVNPKSDTHLVLIKNTNSMGSLTESTEELQDLVGRSQSLMSTNRIPVLAPRRYDRIRLEQVLSNVWTREFLPYPGMEGNRGQKLIRSSANSVMRKLSKTSVTSNFSKRSMSIKSIEEAESDEVGVGDQVEHTSRKSSASHPVKVLHDVDRPVNIPPRRFNLLSRSTVSRTQAPIQDRSCTNSLDNSVLRRIGEHGPKPDNKRQDHFYTPIKTLSIEALRALL